MKSGRWKFQILWMKIFLHLFRWLLFNTRVTCIVKIQLLYYEFLDKDTSTKLNIHTLNQFHKFSQIIIRISLMNWSFQFKNIHNSLWTSYKEVVHQTYMDKMRKLNLGNGFNWSFSFKKLNNVTRSQTINNTRKKKMFSNQPYGTY